MYHLLWRPAKLRQTIDDGAAWIVWRRWSLGDAQFAFAQEDKIGERTADVYAEQEIMLWQMRSAARVLSHREVSLRAHAMT